MVRFATKLLAAASIPLAIAATLTPSPAHADYYRGGYGGYRGGYGYYRGPGVGGIVGGALLGLGVGALLAAPYVAPPPVYYAPPRVYYAPPTYVYAPPPAYYPPPYYYGR